MNIGDEVKVITESYISMRKGLINEPFTWKESNGREDPNVMLGGEYKVLDLSGQYAQVTDSNENNSGMVNVSNLVLLSNIKYCEYKVGEFVRFVPKCNAMDIQYLKLIGYDAEAAKEYKIMHILNNYYLFFDDILDSTSLPMRWCDFKRVER